MKNKAVLTGLCILLAEVLIAVLLWLFGFRITYAPTLENSWDAISAFAAWVGVISSFIAILVAIQIPRKIADHQNKIALFEKRLDVYLTAEKLIDCAHQIKDTPDCLMILSAFYMSIGEREDIENADLLPILLKIDHMERILSSGAFLFPQYDSDQMTLAIIEARNLLLEADRYFEASTEYCVSSEADECQKDVDRSKKILEHRDNYCKLCFGFLKEDQKAR